METFSPFIWLFQLFTMRLCLAVLAVCLSTVSAAPTVDRELDGHWQQWKEWHNKDYHEVSALFVPKHLLFLTFMFCGLTWSLPLPVEGRRMAANGLGEELEKDWAAQPGALAGQAHLPPGNESLWWHGEHDDNSLLSSNITSCTASLKTALKCNQSSQLLEFLTTVPCMWYSV